jgi:TRAP-type mannitol/chloroaromatic compound transport system permease small subunit
MKLIRNIESLVAFVGKAAGMLNLILIAVIVIDISLRTLFSLTGAWVIELESFSCWAFPMRYNRTGTFG